MPTGTYAINFSVGGVSIARSILRSGDHPNVYEVSLPAGKAGTLSTRTNNTDGVATVASGHGITTSDTLDVFWTGGRRYGGTVDSNTSTTVTFSAGTGDNLPTANTAIVITPQVTVNAQIDGDAVVMLGLSLEFTDSAIATAGSADFQDSGSNTIAQVDLVGNVPRVWDITGGDTNSFTGNPITTAMCSNGNGTTAATLKILSLEDSTP